MSTEVVDSTTSVIEKDATILGRIEVSEADSLFARWRFELIVSAILGGLNTMKKVNLLIVTGMSGAGKSVVLNSLEDLGYHCIDNLPPKLLPSLTDLMLEGKEQVVSLAVVTDLRSLDFEAIDDIHHFLEDSHSVNVDVLYLDASDATLVKRYKETRRSHPLSRDKELLYGIEKERELLSPIRKMAPDVIDTTGLSAKQLRERIIATYEFAEEDYFNVTFMSFGFKHGTPIDIDIMFDVRFLPNPFYVEKLRTQTGLDGEVYDFVMENEQSQIFMTKLIDLLEFLIPSYKKEGKNQVIIGIGCTGGQHRSVAISEHLAKKFNSNYSTSARHRNIHLAYKK